MLEPLAGKVKPQIDRVLPSRSYGNIKQHNDLAIFRSVDRSSRFRDDRISFGITFFVAFYIIGSVSLFSGIILVWELITEPEHAYTC